MAGLWTCVDWGRWFEWRISRSLQLLYCFQAEQRTLSCCIREPLVMLSPPRGSRTTDTQGFVRQGPMQGDRCDLTWLRLGHGRRRRWEIRTESWTDWKYQVSIQQRCTSSLSRTSGSEPRCKHTSCDQSGPIAVVTGRDRAPNPCY